VVHARGDALLVQVGEEGLGVPPPGLDAEVLPLRDVEDAEVELAIPLEVERRLLAHERVGKVGQPQGSFDRVVVGEGDEVHPPPPRLLVDRFRLGVAFLPEVPQDRQVRGSRMLRVHVEITAQARSLPLPCRTSFNQPFSSGYIEGHCDCGKVKTRETFGDAPETPPSRRRHTAVGR
jgi:hypothetical protein